MKSLLTSLLVLLVTCQTYSQKTQSLEDMNPGEIRKFLMTQNESDEAKEMIIKHNRSRKSAFVFFGSTILLAIISNNSVNPDEDNKDSILAAVGAWSCGLISLACTISASERMKKAKKIYLDDVGSNMEIGLLDKRGLSPVIRDEVSINHIIFQ